MISNNLKILIFIYILYCTPAHTQEIWRESFELPNKGIWGSENGTIQSDFSEIVNWTLDFPNVELQNEKDYAKTVSTSGGRFEVVDVNGEIVWKSKIIPIEDFIDVNIQLNASETGSNNNTDNKYLKAFFSVDNGDKFFFEVNGENNGNWGSVIVEQKEIKGKELQILVYMSNHYSSDKVILDEVIISAKEKPQEPIREGDILINEVLFNPVSVGSDYVEIYNHSAKEISLNRLYLASRNSNRELTQIYQLSSIQKSFYPESYLALTKDTNGVFPWYDIQCPKCFQQMEKFPSYNNDKDYVVLLDENLQVIDEFFYSEKMHHPILSNEEGISLERISFTRNTNDPKNWHSASTTAGYGTPGYKNSQTETEVTSKPVITFSPESFSPNFDGYNDEYLIKYEVDKPGYVANISIFDESGRFLFKLANNEIINTSGTIEWNGEDQTGQKLKHGVYIVMVELFNPSGETYRYKDGVVITGFLK